MINNNSNNNNNNNSKERKLPIQNCMGKIAVRLKSHGESEIEHN